MNSTLLSRSAVLLYGVFSYAVFLATFLYAVGFIGNFGVSKTIDGPALVSLADALIANGLLLTLFAAQHSVMARPFFKRALARVLPVAAERATYVLASSLALIALFRSWQPMGGVIWSVDQPAVRLLLQAGYGAGWLIVLGTTFLINHFDLFGLRQVWLFFRGRAYTGLKFVTPGPYRLVRHPLYVGWLVAFWCTPVMTVTHLFFAVMTTAYILVAIQFEERDLTDAHPEYHDYRQRTPMLVPRLSRSEETN